MKSDQVCPVLKPLSQCNLLKEKTQCSSTASCPDDDAEAKKSSISENQEDSFSFPDNEQPLILPKFKPNHFLDPCSDEDFTDLSPLSQMSYSQGSSGSPASFGSTTSASPFNSQSSSSSSGVSIKRRRTGNRGRRKRVQKMSSQLNSASSKVLPGRLNMWLKQFDEEPHSTIEKDAISLKGKKIKNL